MAESEHKLFNAEVTAAEEGVEVLPGAKAEVASDMVLRQLVRLESVLRLFKSDVHPGEIPVGIKGFVDEF